MSGRSLKRFRQTLSWGLNALTTFALVQNCGVALGGPLRAIELVDGSTIVGEILSAEQGTYTVKTTFGTITLKDADIRSINSRDTDNRREPPALSTLSKQDAQSTEAIQQRILADPDLANTLNALKDDPEFQQVLHDPKIMEAVQKSDLEYLKANPKIGGLMTNPTVQELSKKLDH